MKNDHIVKHLWYRIGMFCLGLLLQVTIVGCQGVESMSGSRFSEDTPIPEFPGIVPGVSTETDVVRILGNPAAKREQEKYVVYSYQSSVGGMSLPDNIAFQSGIVRLVRVIVIEDSLKLVLTHYGEPEKVTWSPSIHMRTRLFVFARRGFAVVAQNQRPPTESKIVEKWYFEPMSLERFWEELAPAFVPTQDREDGHLEDYWVREP